MNCNSSVACASGGDPSAVGTNLDIRDPSRSRLRTRWMRTLMRKPIDLALGIEFIRRRLTFDWRQHYFSDLHIGVPLGHGLECPIYSPGHWFSFSEIFLSGEYECLLKCIPLPMRWLDLGAHAGFFSLWLIWQRARRNLPRKCCGLLVDADSRAAKAIDRLITTNRLHDLLCFQHGAISQQQEDLRFSERECMSSSAADLPGDGGLQKVVPVLSAKDLMQALSGPYDLVKVDVEGSEFDFLRAYGPVLDQSRYLVIEWHAWHRGGGGGNQIRLMAEDLGFECLTSQAKGKMESLENGSKQCGLLLLRKK